MLNKQLIDYLDQWGVPCTKPAPGIHDGGDSLANWATIGYLRPYCGLESQRWANRAPLFWHNGAQQPIRHPNAELWYGRPHTCSRDQLRPTLYYLGAQMRLGPPAAILELYLKLWDAHKRLWCCLTWNTKRNFQYPTLEEHTAKSTPDVPWNFSSKLPDLTGPEVWATWIRVHTMAAAYTSPAADFTQYLKLKSTYFGRIKLLARKCGMWFKARISSVVRRSALELLDTAQLCGVALDTLLYFCAGHKLKTPILGIKALQVSDDQRNQALGVHFAATYYPTCVSKLTAALYGKKLPLAAADQFWGESAAEPPVNELLHHLYN